ncbi:MAG: hypothetical protein R3C28_33030 [Pirellulaceae bacterium]
MLITVYVKQSIPKIRARNSSRSRIRLALMFERLPRERIIPAQESSTNTTVHDMQDLNFIRINVACHELGEA